MWDEDAAKSLGATIRDLRFAAGLSQEGLAYRAGVTKNQVQLIEAGRASGKREDTGTSNPRTATLMGLAEVLGVTVSDLFARAGL